MKATIIREPWISLILRGEKTWEMRSQPAAHRGLIGLIRKGSGHVVAAAQLVNSLPPLNVESYTDTEPFHRVPRSEQAAVIKAGWVYPWVLAGVQPLNPSVPYVHRGGVTWVNLANEVAASILDQIGGQLNDIPGISSSALNVRPHERTDSMPTTPLRPVAGRPLSSKGHRREVELNAPNIRHSHIYLSSIIDFFPSDAIGGSNKDQIAAKFLTVTFNPGKTVQTDIAGDKKVLRVRSSVLRDFFDRPGATPGDVVQIERSATYAFTFSLRRS